MHLRLQKIALALWILSLALPAAETNKGDLLFGYHILGKSFLLAFFGITSFPLHSISAFTNLIFIKEIHSFIFSFASQSHPPMQGTAIIAGALAVNIYITGHAAFSNHPISFGTLLHPAHYVWLSSFAILFAASILKTKADSSNSETSKL